ncbi:unnamed protein product [Acanthoscelides obtectus]|uniref:Uncharacterized protein n=1 Tax=Acanthoscelides obtectus TaxID=200917 RepID=A0A9P0LIT6_ACAOB|nr:unnamed protein product [Acanthoscelides obtectus]CAK1663116.1 hypothetical protein AOBTE_LOCUS23486 [Acanthoscelides obtectus]
MTSWSIKEEDTLKSLIVYGITKINMGMKLALEKTEVIILSGDKMTSACAKRCRSVLAVAAIFALGVLIAIVWVQFGQSVSKHRLHSINVTSLQSAQRKSDGTMVDRKGKDGKDECVNEQGHRLMAYNFESDRNMFGFYY